MEESRLGTAWTWGGRQSTSYVQSVLRPDRNIFANKMRESAKDRRFGNRGAPDRRPTGRPPSSLGHRRSRTENPQLHESPVVFFMTWVESRHTISTTTVGRPVKHLFDIPILRSSSPAEQKDGRANEAVTKTINRNWRRMEFSI